MDLPSRQSAALNLSNPVPELETLLGGLPMVLIAREVWTMMKVDKDASTRANSDTT